MAIFQIESGACIGRGFADVDVDGFCAKFKTWVVKNAAAGGPNWKILLDRSTLPVDKTITAVDTGTEVLTSVDHKFYTSEGVVYTCSATPIGGISSGNTYYVKKIDKDTFTLHTTQSGATTLGTTPINLTSFPAGTHTLILQGPYIIVAPTVPATVNEVSKILKINYFSSDSGYIRIWSYLSWDDTNKTPRGFWSILRINTVDSGSFAYDFRGGDECMAISSRISTDWTYTVIDEWEGITKFVEAPGIIGNVQGNISLGTDVVVQLDTGEASLFTVGNYYYIYDFNNRNYVNYVKIKAKDNGLDTITLTQLWNNMTIGAIIGAYPHRFYCTGSTTNTSYYCDQIPYVSDPTNTYQFCPQNSGNSIYIEIYFVTFSPWTSNRLSPDDNGLYACMKPVISEYVNNINSLTSMNRFYGKVKNIFFTFGSMAQMLDWRLINTKEYLKLNNANGSSSANHLILHTESLV
jgi:hypothetical protein